MGAEHEGKSQGLLAGEGKVEEESFSFMPSSVPGALCERNKLISWWVIALLPLRRQVKWRISSKSKIILLRKLYFQNCFKGNFIADLGHTFRTTTCVCVCVCVQSLSCVWLFVTPWTVAHQAPLSIELSRQEHWSGLPFPSPGDLPDPKTEPRPPGIGRSGQFFAIWPTREAQLHTYIHSFLILSSIMVYPSRLDIVPCAM